MRRFMKPPLRENLRLISMCSQTLSVYVGQNLQCSASSLRHELRPVEPEAAVIRVARILGIGRSEKDDAIHWTCTRRREVAAEDLHHSRGSRSKHDLEADSLR